MPPVYAEGDESHMKSLLVAEDSCLVHHVMWV